MSENGLAVFDTTIQETNEWLDGIMAGLGTTDRQTAYDAMRGALHALRDFITPTEAANLSAQLPMLVRGIYYEGWKPTNAPAQARSRADFLDRVGMAFRDSFPVSPERAARAVFAELDRRVTRGEMDEVRNQLPKDVRELWPPVVMPGNPEVTGAQQHGQFRETVQ